MPDGTLKPVAPESAAEDAEDADAEPPIPPVPDEEPDAKKPAAKAADAKNPPFPLPDKKPVDIDDVKPGPVKDTDPAPKPDGIKIPADGFDLPKKPADGVQPPVPGPATLPDDVKKPLPPPGGAAHTGAADSVLVALQVPSRAKVFINGRATASTGPMRQFVSRGLTPGYAYQYEIRAEINRNGRLVSDTKTLTLRAGEQASLRFDLPQQAQRVETTVSIQVPANAKVFLAGSPTKSTGRERTFTTTRLTAGQAWENYTVRVVADVNGQSVTQSRTIKLIGGEDQTLTFRFAEDKLAATTAAGAR
ncbi:MAG: TIGR03000 domain-containing protein [Planctomycetes bacterium]|nr:TIGR03000 domain-containing protein [Planctomycetota bacterium]